MQEKSEIFLSRTADFLYYIDFQWTMDYDFFEPQISRITLIFHRLNLDAQAHKFHRFADAKKEFTQNLLNNFLRISCSPPKAEKFPVFTY